MVISVLVLAVSQALSQRHTSQSEAGGQ
jgi:hypothetical protein